MRLESASKGSAPSSMHFYTLGRNICYPAFKSGQTPSVTCIWQETCASCLACNTAALSARTRKRSFLCNENILRNVLSLQPYWMYVVPQTMQRHAFDPGPPTAENNRRPEKRSKLVGHTSGIVFRAGTGRACGAGTSTHSSPESPSFFALPLSPPPAFPPFCSPPPDPRVVRFPFAAAFWAPFSFGSSNGVASGCVGSMVATISVEECHRF
jgi:hypothetical protein